MKKFIAFSILLSFVIVLQACDTKKPTLEFEEQEISVAIGETFTLEPKTDAKGKDAAVTYTIADEEILSFKDGIFTAEKAGTTTIVAKLKRHPKVRFTIEVTVKDMVSLAFELGGGIFEEEVPQRLEVEQLPMTLPIPSRVDHRFVGWYDNPNFTGKYIDEIPEGVRGKVTYYARWVPIKEYIITYVTYGGTNSPNNPNRYTIYDLPITLEEPTRPGYIFKGWFTDRHFRHPFEEEITLAKNYTLYALWESEVDQDQILIDSSLTDKVEGDRINYRGIEYIYGINAFSTLKDGFSVARDTVYLVGEFEENLEIGTSGLTIIGPNAGINPNTEERETEVVLKGKIELKPNVGNIIFDGLAFTGNAQILGSISHNIQFVNNYVYDTTQATQEWRETNGYTSGFFAFHATFNDVLTDFTIKNNKFVNVSDVNLNFSRIRNIHVEGNTFKNFDRDAIRFDNGGLNHGKLTFLNNNFENDTLSGYNGIYFRVYGGNEELPTTIRIENNRFKNIGNAEIAQFSGAISMRNYQGKSTEVIIEYNIFEGCSNFIHIRNNATEENHTNYPWSGKINGNIFKGIPLNYYFKNWIDSDDANTNPESMDFQYNYFEDQEGNPIVDLSNYLDKILHVSSYSNNYPSKEAYDVMLESLEIKEISIVNPIDELRVGEEYEIITSIQPILLDGSQLKFETSNPNVLQVTEDGRLIAVDQGTAIITVTSPSNPNIQASMEIVVPDSVQLEIHFDGNGALDIGEELTLTPVVKDGLDYTYQWESSNSMIATVDQNGVVKAIAPGEVTITVKIKGRSNISTIRLTIYDREQTSDIIKYFIDNNRGSVTHNSIYYIGSDDGSKDYLNTFYLSVNNYLFENIQIIRNMIAETRKNYSGITMPSIEFITIHDTANSGAGAKANSDFVVTGDTSSSWHYTVGNDGIYKQLEDHIVGWHAGDGSRRFNLIDSGVKATTDKPVVTINERGFFTFNGEESTILAPSVAQITEYGIYVTIGENGNYWMNESYFNSTYNMVVNHGGNYNSIGIETAVNTGSDIHFTWQRTAKLVAQLMDTHGLGLDRIMFHNSFSGKPCPRTMITAGLEEEFLNLIRAEYEFQQQFKDYTVSFESHNPEILGNNGRIIQAPTETTTVSYTITVTKGNVSESITLNAVVYAK